MSSVKIHPSVKEMTIKMKPASILVVYIAVCTLDICSSFQSQRVKSLVKNLTTKYDPSVRPVKNESEPLPIGVEFGLQSVLSLDERNEIFTCRGWFNMIWYDQYLEWNATDNLPELVMVPMNTV